MTSYLKKNYSLLEKNIVIILFLLIVLSDTLTKILISDFLAISRYVKAFFLLFLLIYIVISKSKFIPYFLIAILFFTIGCLTISFDRFLENTPQFFEYYFIVFFFLFIKNRNATHLKRVLELVFIYHAIIIILAVSFDITFLKTYTYSDRFGYTSFFNSQNEFSYIMIAGIVYFTALLSRNSFFSFVRLFVFLIASFMVGTKAIWIFVFAFYVCLLILYTKPKVYLSLFSAFVIGFLVFWKNIIHFFKSHYETLYEVYQSEGLVSLLSSKRSTYFMERFSQNFEEFTFLNYLFGSNNLKFIYEMSFFDLISFLGFIGVGLYVFIIKRFLIDWFKRERFLMVYFILVTSLSFVAGYLIENASAQVYTLLVMIFLNYHLGDSIFSDKNKENINAKK